MKVVLLTVSIFHLIGCAGSGLPNFPAEYVFVVKPDIQQCSMHRIIKQDPITVDKGHIIPWEECPDVIGFNVTDSGAVFNWIREAQRIAKERCK